MEAAADDVCYPLEADFFVNFAQFRQEHHQASPLPSASFLLGLPEHWPSRRRGEMKRSSIDAASFHVPSAFADWRRWTLEFPSVSLPSG
jgi:hypothetical protein